MKYKITILSLFIFFIMIEINAQKQNPISVSFQLTATALSENSSVYITGSIEPLGDWDPGKIKMNYVGNYVWSFNVNIDKPISVEYKFTLGTWEHEGAKSDGTPLSNLSAQLQHDTTFSDTIDNWTKNTQNQTTEHHVTGTVKYYPAVKGKGIKDRDVAVWLPPDYDSSGNTRYPVLYMQDGQNSFDPATSAFGVEWGVDETSDSLIRKGIIAPLIVVGIYNTTDRSFEYALGAKGEAYMNFMIHQLKPLIDSAYATNKDKEHTFVGGSSLGALISFMLVWQHPNVFSKAICFSPAFKINKLDYVKNVTSYRGKMKPVSFYIANGGVGLDAQLQPGVNAMLAALQKQGYKEGTEVKYVNDIKAAHSEASWAKAFPDAIMWCMDGK
ncbi:MAG: alpha/beta hydrolase-fold protein [Bacteroidota bacterium]|nr:alpha/beta hydrolase-fold protein [Bacteroidota bacterium]